MTTSVSTIATEHGSRYLQQVCKHFAHEIPVSFDPMAGHIDFPIGAVDLDADARGLTITVTPTDAEQGEALRDVVAHHLVRFAFREELAVDWQTRAA